MRVAVIGSGYVGVVTGACLAAKGHDVTCLDTRQEVVDHLNRGEPHIHEAGLPSLLGKAVADGVFRAELMSPERLFGADIVLVAVGTPTTDGGRIDLTQIEDASRSVGAYLRGTPGFLSVVVKSTVVPGTTDTFVRGIIESESGLRVGEFGLGMNPEFLREGNGVADFMEPDRIVLGHEDTETLRCLRELYMPWDCEKLEVNSRTAEMIKYANNCLLATQISAVNELANIAAAIGSVDIVDVMQGVYLDGRWNPVLPGGKRVSPGVLTYLAPGCGFGGSCFPKDVQAMRGAAEDAGVTPHLLEAVLEINRAQPLQVVGLLERGLGDLSGKRILLLGLAFKPGTDDVRESVSLRIIESLDQAAAEVVLHDPVASRNCQRLYPVSKRRRYVSDWRDEVPAADAVVVATRWDDYFDLVRQTDLNHALNGKVLVDARRMFAAEQFPDAQYLAIGRTISLETAVNR